MSQRNGSWNEVENMEIDSDETNLDDTRALISLPESEQRAVSAPININTRNRRYTIHPDEYRVIEEHPCWNPNEACSEVNICETNHTMEWFYFFVSFSYDSRSL